MSDTKKTETMAESVANTETNVNALVLSVGTLTNQVENLTNTQTNLVASLQTALDAINKLGGVPTGEGGSPAPSAPVDISSLATSAQVADVLTAVEAVSTKVDEIALEVTPDEEAEEPAEGEKSAA